MRSIFGRRSLSLSSWSSGCAMPVSTRSAFKTEECSPFCPRSREVDDSPPVEEDRSSSPRYPRRGRARSRARQLYSRALRPAEKHAFPLGPRHSSSHPGASIHEFGLPPLVSEAFSLSDFPLSDSKRTSFLLLLFFNFFRQRLHFLRPLFSRPPRQIHRDLWRLAHP